MQRTLQKASTEFAFLHHIHIVDAQPIDPVRKAKQAGESWVGLSLPRAVCIADPVCLLLGYIQIRPVCNLAGGAFAVAHRLMHVGVGKGPLAPDAGDGDCLVQPR